MDAGSEICCGISVGALVGLIIGIVVLIVIIVVLACYKMKQQERELRREEVNNSKNVPYS